MRYLFKLTGLLIGMLFVTVGAMAAVVSPVTTLNQVANQMIAQLQQNQANLKTAKANTIIDGIVDNLLMPNIDVNRMAAAVVGRQYWLSATPAQQQTFVQEFKKLVTSTYASALASYNGDQVQFYPIRGDYTSSNNVQVQSVITRKNGQKIGINYNVVRSGDSWKVYDFSIENISMVQSYRSQFANVLASGGMNQLLQQLHAHNQQNQ